MAEQLITTIGPYLVLFACSLTGIIGWRLGSIFKKMELEKQFAEDRLRVDAYKEYSSREHEELRRKCTEIQKIATEIMQSSTRTSDTINVGMNDSDMGSKEVFLDG